MTGTAHDLLAPLLDEPGRLAAVEQVPLAERGLPASSWAALERRAVLTPDRPAVTFIPEGARYEDGTTWSYADLLREVRQCVHAFTDLGIGPGDAVGLLSTNCSQLLTAVFAAETAGVAAPLNPGLSPDRLEALLRTAGSQVLVAAGPELDPAIWRTALELAERVGLRAVLAVRPDAGTPGPERPVLAGVPGTVVAYLEDVTADRPADGPLPRLPGAGDVASYFHTGGTTGAPKLAVHTHRNEIVAAWGLAAGRWLPDDAVILAGLPLFHVNALVVTALAPLIHGQHVLWAGPLGYRDPTLYGHFWRIVERYRVAGMSAVPTVYAVLSQIPVDADISSLQAAAVGAAPLPEAVRRDFESHTGVELVEGYGLTEAGCASARTLPGHRRPGSVGQRMPYQRIKAVAVDADTGAWTDLPPGRTGLLVIGGPTVFPGYLRRGPGGAAPDARGHVRDGWLDTGDLGHVDEDGHVYLVGRAKDLIIRGGHNIDPAVVEDALLEHPSVTGAAAVGRPDAHSGEVPVVYVTLSAPVAESELVSWARDRMPERAAVPRHVHVLDALPLTLIGKPDKQALRADSIRRVALGELEALRENASDRVTVTVDMQTADGRPAVTVTGLGSDDGELLLGRLQRYGFRTRIA